MEYDSRKPLFNFGRITLRARLTLWTIAIFTLILWAFGGVFWLYDSNAIRREFVANLDARGQAIAEMAVSEIPGLTREGLRQIVEDEVVSSRIGYFMVDVFDLEGNHALSDSSPIVQTSSLPIDRVTQQSLYPDGTTRYSMPVPSPVWTEHAGRSASDPMVRSVVIWVARPNEDGYIVFLAATDLFARSRLEELSTTLLILAAVVPMLSALGGWFVAGIAVQPFADLRSMASDMRAETLDDALELDSSSPEVAALTEELDEARRNIRDAFEAQERFLSNVSHEIKTPIAVMRVEAQTLDTSGSSDDVREFVDSVQQEMKRLGNLVESFLTLTRIEDGHGQIRGKRYALNDLVMDSVEQCALMANQQHVWLRPELFAEDETIDASVAGDPELLTTMLDNLIRNAINHSPADTGVSITLKIEGNLTRITVIDEGPGIPTERIDSVFDRFSQAGGATRKGRGHGLGLTIAKGIAELHQGTILVRSEEGNGCEFEITLPLLRA